MNNYNGCGMIAVVTIDTQYEPGGSMMKQRLMAMKIQEEASSSQNQGTKGFDGLCSGNENKRKIMAVKVENKGTSKVIENDTKTYSYQNNVLEAMQIEDPKTINNKKTMAIKFDCSHPQKEKIYEQAAELMQKKKNVAIECSHDEYKIEESDKGVFINGVFLMNCTVEIRELKRESLSTGFKDYFEVAVYLPNGMVRYRRIRVKEFREGQWLFSVK